MATTEFFEELKKYDYIQYVVPDLFGLPRGKIVKGKFKEKVAQKGYESGSAICGIGPNGEAAMSCLPLLGTHLPNAEVQPCLNTLKPWPWVGGQGRRVGNVLCDLFSFDGQPHCSSPRQLMKTLLHRLRETHGLELRTAFEYEFNVFTDTEARHPLGGPASNCFALYSWNENHDLFCDLCDLLDVMGIEVSSFVSEFGAGQFEITTDPLEGEKGGDVAFYMKNAIKGFFHSKGHLATFMSRPWPDSYANGLHMNHSLWTATGDKGEPVNVLYDSSDPDRLSATARHWIAGIVHHGPALTALCCPTLNCFNRLGKFLTPSKADWGVDDRNALLRARTAKASNVFLENRLPSGAANPYLAIAATVAAGLDGLDRKLDCPQPMDKQAVAVPTSLADAFEALEKDQELVTSLGQSFVDLYVAIKREMEIASFEKAHLNTEEKQFEFHRKLYLARL